MKNVLLIFGTRPEAIKLAPVYHELKRYPDTFDVKVCVTAQHRELLDQVTDFFQLPVDFDLDLMSPDQSLFDITVKGLKGLESVLHTYPADLILVQGDTTTVFIGALAGFYKQIPVGHVEAGLRSYCKTSPYPEEMNRILAGHLSTFHFAPTDTAVENLKHEHITAHVYKVGNTVIDALNQALSLLQEGHYPDVATRFPHIDFSRRTLLVTGHRRENFGEPFRTICHALKDLANRYPDLNIVYPVHLNPHVRTPVYDIIGDQPTIHLLPPLSYPELIWLMNQSVLVLTDSGGIQEEAPALGKPVLVMREVTERMEGIHAGTAALVGTRRSAIVSQVSQLLDDAVKYNTMANAVNPYGDGTAARQIVHILAGME